MLTLSVRSSLGMMLFMSAADTYKGQEVQERKGVLLVQVQLDSFESRLHFHSRGSRIQLKTEQQQERINSRLMLQQLQICYLLLCSSGVVMRKDICSVLSVSWAGILRCRGTRLEGKQWSDYSKEIHLAEQWISPDTSLDKYRESVFSNDAKHSYGERQQFWNQKLSQKLSLWLCKYLFHFVQ